MKKGFTPKIEAILVSFSVLLEWKRSSLLKKSKIIDIVTTMGLEFGFSEKYWAIWNALL